MKTQIKCNSRLEVLNTILKLERLSIEYIENEQGVLVDIEPERAWAISLI